MGVGPFGIAAAACVIAAAVSAPPGSAASVEWCGRDEVATDRLPDATTGRQIHVTYAIPSDGANRFSALASEIVSDLAFIDAWWRQQDSTRTLRFDTFEFPGCGSAFGKIDLSLARLPETGESYRPLSGRWEKIGAHLAAQPFSFTNVHKKHLVYYDGPVDGNVCGTAGGDPQAGGRFSQAIVYLQGPCPLAVGQGLIGATAAAHETVHMLGALDSRGGPPHACSGDAGHPCDSEDDLLWPFASLRVLQNYRLDVGRDDYYDHSGSWFDIRDSDWLERLDLPRHTVTVTMRGQNTRIVADLPGFTPCAATCTTTWQHGTILQLGLDAPAGTTWRGWSGACTGFSTCTLTVDGPKTLTATMVFAVTLTVATSGDGEGAVTGPAGLSCPPSCAASVDNGSTVTLRASPRRGSRFGGWEGACSGTAATCTLTLEESQNVTARFVRAIERLTVRVTGKGTVKSTPAGVSCPPTCTSSFPVDSNVRLVARPNRGWRFAGWTGRCSGKGACSVFLLEQAAVGAKFVRVR